MLADLDGAAVGLAAMRAEWLDALYVVPSCWGTGVGSRLHDNAVTWIRDFGCRHSHLWVLEQKTRARPLLREARNPGPANASAVLYAVELKPRRIRRTLTRLKRRTGSNSAAVQNGLGTQAGSSRNSPPFALLARSGGLVATAAT